MSAFHRNHILSLLAEFERSTGTGNMVRANKMMHKIITGLLDLIDGKSTGPIATAAQSANGATLLTGTTMFPAATTLLLECAPTEADSVEPGPTPATDMTSLLLSVPADASMAEIAEIAAETALDAQAGVNEFGDRADHDYAPGEVDTTFDEEVAEPAAQEPVEAAAPVPAEDAAVEASEPAQPAQADADEPAHKKPAHGKRKKD